MSKRKSKYNEAIVNVVFQEEGLPAPVFEYRFHDERRWRFDMAWPKYKIALEVEGGVWTAGRHTRPSGFLKDMEKYNAACALGWRVLRTVPDDLLMQETIELVREAMRWQLSRIPA